MRVHIKIGDVLNESADILVASANPFLNLSGGVGGALLERCGPELQDELWRYLAASKQAPDQEQSYARRRLAYLSNEFFMLLQSTLFTIQASNLFAALFQSALKRRSRSAP